MTVSVAKFAISSNKFEAGLAQTVNENFYSGASLSHSYRISLFLIVRYVAFGFNGNGEGFANRWQTLPDYGSIAGVVTAIRPEEFRRLTTASGSAQAESTPCAPTRKYWRPSNSYVIGELPTVAPA